MLKIIMILNSNISIKNIKIERASSEDAFLIAELYNSVYHGVYVDSMMANPESIMEALSQPDYCWIVAHYREHIVGSVVYRYDSHNALAKVYGAVVHQKFRGHDLTERMIRYGFEILKRAKPSVQVVYAMTRTVSPAPQKLTENLGFKRVGIFPNVHKTDLYETHGLVVLHSLSALKTRFTNFKLHPKVAKLYEITREECGLDPLPLANAKISSKNIKTSKTIALEAIHAPQFVKHRFYEEKRAEKRQSWFFPFHEPNLLLTSTDQRTEVFCYLSTRDKHCVIIGVRDTTGYGLKRLLDSAVWVLHEIGARYVELLLRADELSSIESVIQSEFIPCAYFPAMYLSNKKRYDFVVFSRSFEILNFKNIKLEGVNKQYLLQYFDLWTEASIGL